MSTISQTPEAAIKQVGDELRAQARVRGFQNPVVMEFALWHVKLSFGSALELEKLKGIEAMQREQMKLPPRDPHKRVRDTWHLSIEVKPGLSIDKAAEIDPEAVKQAYAMLGMLVAAVGVPQRLLVGRPIETKSRSGETLTQWQWQDE